MISIIVATSTNNVIGRDGDLPWKISEDLKRFRRLTMGKPVVMGRRTWESIGKPLPGRQNIVMTRRPGFQPDGCDVVASPAEALSAAGDSQEIMIIGGSEIYALFLPKATKLYLTRVHAEIDGDTCFPEIDEDQWQLVESEGHASDGIDQFAFEFRTYQRRGYS